MLKITASLADGYPSTSARHLTGLDQHNLQLLSTAIRHAAARAAAGVP